MIKKDKIMQIQVHIKIDRRMFAINESLKLCDHFDDQKQATIKKKTRIEKAKMSWWRKEKTLEALIEKLTVHKK